MKRRFLLHATSLDHLLFLENYDVACEISILLRNASRVMSNARSEN